MTARIGIVAVAALVLLAACNREGDSSKQGAAPAASAPAQGASAAASQPAPGASAAAAQPLVPQQVVTAAAVNPQDAQAGQQLAQQGAGAAAACVGCHGANGEGNAQSGFPRLAGQGRLYLVHQLESYANGSRKHPVMQPIAAALDETQRQQVAAYYAGLGTPPGTNAATPQREPVLASRGDDKRQLQACANCHAPQGIGDAAFNPYLAGQHASYLTAALAAWKSGDRNNDPSGQMPRIAKTLTEDDVRTLVQYYASLTPPGPRNAQIAAAALPAGRTAVQSGPASATAPVQGKGTEQGALGGGAQGQTPAGGAQSEARTSNAGGNAQAPAAGASSSSPASGKP
ncbi:MAG TPA: c-type cytochrome [Ramlibacter sp.]